MFKQSASGKVTLSLAPDEANLLIDLYKQMHNLLETPDVPENTDPLAVLVGLDGPTQEPADPAVARLFPNAYLEDKAAAKDFRRYTEPDLRSEKLQNLDLAINSLEQGNETIELDPPEVKAWLKSLNDLRLVLGTRIGITEDYREEIADDPGFHLYDYLTYLQGSLIDAL